MGLESFTYDEINSLDYGMYVTQKTVWDAPKRVVSMIQVAGRNGDLTIDEGKYENARVRYTLKCNATTKDEFAEKVKLFRNELCSRTGYKRLTDTYNQGEYRMGVFITEFSVTGQFNNTAGVFDVEFNCKPQRFLTSGETERSIPEWSDLHTDSGSLVTIDNSGGEYAVKSLSTNIVPQQNLNGYDHPWAGGAGKNLLVNYSGQTQTKNNVTATWDSQGVVTVNGTGNNTAFTTFSGQSATLPAGSYTVNGQNNVDSTNKKLTLQVFNLDTNKQIVNLDTGADYTFTLSAETNIAVRVGLRVGVSVSNVKMYPMIRLSSITDSTFAPYENICPITGFSSANIYVSPTTSVGDATTYNISFGTAGTVYGGTLDVVSGQLTVTHKIISENDFYAVSSGTSGGGLHYANVNQSGYPAATSSNSLSNMLVNNQSGWGSTTPCYTTNTSGNPVRVYGVFTTLAEFKTAYAGLQIVYELATPLTYQLTTTQVAFLLGTNNIWSNTGDIQIEYGKGGNTLYNPTLFDSLPLIKVTGTGTLGIGDWILTITGLSSQTLYIDCDMMEVYKNTGGIIEGANSLVSINKNTFPKLVPGMNNITKTSGLTNLKITPRWWRI